MSETVRFDRALITRYDRSGPRYTSYPTAPQFNEAFDNEAYRAAATATNEDPMPTPLSAYVHIPFCQSLCYYCACNKIITRHTEKAAHYLGYLKREIDLHAALFDDDRPLAQLHLGGGTPSYMNDDQLAELFAAFRRRFQVAPDAELEASIELDPRTVDAARIQALRETGFNRVSFGVQDFDPAVQAAINRMHSVEQVESLVTAARGSGFRSVSIDLIYGLPKQTVESFATTLDTIIRLRPDRLAIYNYAHLPHLFRAQKLIKDADLPTPAEKLDLFELCVTRLTQAGYVHIGMDHFALPDDELAIARRDGTLQRNFQGYSTHADWDLIGIGITAIGNVGPTYSQNVRHLLHYYRRLDNNRLPIMRGYRLSTDDRIRRTLIQDLMCRDRIDFREIENRFPIAFRNYFSAELEALKPMAEDGLLTVGHDAVTLLPAGRLLMRNVAMVFDRYLTANRTQTFSRTV